MGRGGDSLRPATTAISTTCLRLSNGMRAVWTLERSARDAMRTRGALGEVRIPGYARQCSHHERTQHHEHDQNQDLRRSKSHRRSLIQRVSERSDATRSWRRRAAAVARARRVLQPARRKGAPSPRAWCGRARRMPTRSLVVSDARAGRGPEAPIARGTQTSIEPPELGALSAIARTQRFRGETRPARSILARGLAVAGTSEWQSVTTEKALCALRSQPFAEVANRLACSDDRYRGHDLPGGITT
jgi:hypothetical protein